jgi:hypothetical protein
VAWSTESRSSFSTTVSLENAEGGAHHFQPLWLHDLFQKPGRVHAFVFALSPAAASTIDAAKETRGCRSTPRRDSILSLSEEFRTAQPTLPLRRSRRI